jgi:transposase
MKNFKPYNPDQPFLLPPALRDWLPEGHLALFISDVVEAMDLSAILATYKEGDGRGQPAYHPSMMVRLLLYAYCTGTASSRKIERKTYEDVAYRVLTANQHPDHDSIADFRKRQLQALAELFRQVLQLCQAAGLVKLGHVALDGTKIKANASKHKAMSYERMTETEKRLQQEVEALLANAEHTDAAEDKQYGQGRRGGELPEELARRESRLKKIREAKEALEQEAKARAAEKSEAGRNRIEERQRQEQETGKKVPGPLPQVPDPEKAVPDGKAQRNFTDPESRIMKDGATKSFEQAYNAQAAVDSTAQIIVAAAITQEPNDKRQLVPIMEQVAENLGQMPPQASADAGYFSTANVQDPRLAGVDLYVPPDRQKHTPDGEEETDRASAKQDDAVIEAMRQKVKAPEGRAIYARRKAVVEPVFGQIKEVRGFRRFSFRGKVKVAAEWQLTCLTHNLLKLFRAKACLQPS